MASAPTSKKAKVLDLPKSQPTAELVKTPPPMPPLPTVDQIDLVLRASEGMRPTSLPGVNGLYEGRENLWALKRWITEYGD